MVVFEDGGRYNDAICSLRRVKSAVTAMFAQKFAAIAKKDNAILYFWALIKAIH